jgi:hypothetical protein
MVMKRWIFLFVCFAESAFAQGTMQTVVPFGFQNQSGNGASQLFLGGETQDLFRASYMATAWTTPVAITGVAFRVAGGFSMDVVIPSIEIRASTSSRVPETMSQAYAANRGADEVLVFGHSNVHLVGSGGPGVNPFDLKLTFDQPFLYDPATGSLLLDFRIGTPAPGGTSAVDSQSYAQLGGAPAASVFQGGAFVGQVGAGSHIIQFQTVSVPEPGILWLSIPGGLSLWLRRRLK